MGLFDEIFRPKKIKFHCPYSKDKTIRQEQVWDNLQKGILLEDKGIFLSWDTDFNEIDRICSKRSKMNGRINWYLGEHKILDGMTCHIEVEQWPYQPNISTFDQFSDNLGHDTEGNKRFHERIAHLTNVLGEPNSTNLEKWGPYDIGSVTWVKDEIQIYVSGAEIFNCRYHLKIGRIDNSEKRYFQAAMDDLRAKGFTDEDFGK